MELEEVREARCKMQEAKVRNKELEKFLEIPSVLRGF